MLYTGYDIQRSWLAGAGKIAQAHADVLKNFTGPFSVGGLAPIAASALDVFAHSVLPRGKPAFGLDNVTVDGKTLPVQEENMARKPFGQLKRFVYEGSSAKPTLLICAPMSGHFCNAVARHGGTYDSNA
jgi:poly(3-hydroxybutyrate) depolymerase